MDKLTKSELEALLALLCSSQKIATLHEVHYEEEAGKVAARRIEAIGDVIIERAFPDED